MYRIIAVCLVLLITACGEADKVPKDVLSKEKMRDVLLDLNMADAYAGQSEDGGLVLSDSIRVSRLKVYYRQILDLHKLTPEEFNHSYKYYEAHPNKFKSVYDMMMDKVTSEKSGMELEVRRKEYITNRHSLLPVNNNPLNSRDQDTIIPFVKRNKSGINSGGSPVSQPKKVLPTPQKMVKPLKAAKLLKPTR